MDWLGDLLLSEAVSGIRAARYRFAAPHTTDLRAASGDAGGSQHHRDFSGDYCDLSLGRSDICRRDTDLPMGKNT